MGCIQREGNFSHEKRPLQSNYNESLTTKRVLAKTIFKQTNKQKTLLKMTVRFLTRIIVLLLLLFLI